MFSCAGKIEHHASHIRIVTREDRDQTDEIKYQTEIFNECLYEPPLTFGVQQLKIKVCVMTKFATFCVGTVGAIGLNTYHHRTTITTMVFEVED